MPPLAARSPPLHLLEHTEFPPASITRHIRSVGIRPYMPLAAYMVNFAFDTPTRSPSSSPANPSCASCSDMLPSLPCASASVSPITCRPWLLEETCRYIDHHTVRCGRPASIFDADAKADIHRHAGGVPRLVNAVCYRSILHAVVQRHQHHRLHQHRYR